MDANPLTEQELQSRGIYNDPATNDRNVIFTLNITGQHINNGVVVVCNAISVGSAVPDVRKAEFTLNTLPVKDLGVRFNPLGQIMNSSWVPPHCLPLNYTYRVLVSNDTMIVTTSNTTEPEYTMQNVSSCTNYTVNVTVIDTGSTEGFESVPTAKTEQSDFLGGM